MEEALDLLPLVVAVVGLQVGPIGDLTGAPELLDDADAGVGEVPIRVDDVEDLGLEEFLSP
jgi:hypothetical protein